MSRVALAALSIFLTSVTPAVARDGMIALPCVHSARVSMDGLERIARNRGMHIFARIDHAKGAGSAGMTLRYTEVMIFGHPKLGTPLLQCAQTYGIDLPMRVLSWEDETGKGWLGYADPSALGDNHSNPECDMVLRKLITVVDELVREAAKENLPMETNTK